LWALSAFNKRFITAGTTSTSIIEGLSNDSEMLLQR
jgi:hypothetical protein